MRQALAIFDIDGTLLPGRSAETIFVRFLFARGELTPADGARWVGRFLRTLPSGLVAAAKANKGYLTGKEADRIRALAAECYATGIAPRVPEAARRLVADHRDAGRRIVLLSGTIDCLIERFCDDLEADEAIGTALEVRDGRYTGAVEGLHPYGEAKEAIADARWGDGTYDFGRSSAYCDRASDLPLLNMVGHPVIVNPSPTLDSLARRLCIETISIR